MLDLFDDDDLPSGGPPMMKKQRAVYIPTEKMLEGYLVSASC